MPFAAGKLSPPEFLSLCCGQCFQVLSNDFRFLESLPEQNEQNKQNGFLRLRKRASNSVHFVNSVRSSGYSTFRPKSVAPQRPLPISVIAAPPVAPERCAEADPRPATPEPWHRRAIFCL